MLAIVAWLAVTGPSSALGDVTEATLVGSADASQAPTPHVAHGPRRLSKKQAWLDEKRWRAPNRVEERTLERTFAASRRTAEPARSKLVPAPPQPAAGARLEPVTTLYNVWTRESLPLLPGLAPVGQMHAFLRDHFTNQATTMDEDLMDVLASAARHFRARRIEVVSGYRSPKYQLMLRKKGREVARQSQHCEGKAVDFRIRGVDTRTLLRFVRGLRRGGVGFYPHSQFVHCDTGRVRFWKGT